MEERRRSAMSRSRRTGIAPSLPCVIVAGFILVSTGLAQKSNNTRTCYVRNGEEHLQGQACDEENGGPCCEIGHVCLSNGLCWDAFFNHIVRASCTNKDWKGCSNLCPNSPGFGDLRQCNNDNENKWICGFDTTKCQNPFPLEPGFVQDLRPPGQNAIKQAANCEGSPTSSSPPSSSTSAGFSPLSAQDSGATCKDSGPSAVTTGVGAGVGVGVPLLIALMVTLWMLRKARRELADERNAHGRGYPGYSKGSPQGLEQIHEMPITNPARLHEVPATSVRWNKLH